MCEIAGKGVGCLMDIPEAKASTSGHFCVALRSSEFRFVSKMWSFAVCLPYHGYPSLEKSVNVNHLFPDCCRHCSLNCQPWIRHQHLYAHAYLLSRHTNCVFFSHDIVLWTASFSLFPHMAIMQFCEILGIPFLFLQKKYPVCQERAPHTAQLQTRYTK